MFTYGRPERQPQKRRPPNYSSRWLQVRLFFLVSMVLFVLLAMYRVSDPEFWSFMGFDRASEDRLDDTESGEVDTRLFNEPGKRELPPGTVRMIQGDKPLDTDVDTDLLSSEELLRLNRSRGWLAAVGMLDDQSQDLLNLLLKLSRQDESLPEDQRDAWRGLKLLLDAHWQSFIDKATKDVEAMPSDQRTRWLPVLAGFMRHWGEEKQALDAVATGGRVLERDRRALDDLQTLLDELALREIEDSTPTSRGVEKSAWYRLFDRLNSASLSELESQSPEKVGFLKLFRQPETYRGKLVTVEGTARLGYYIKERPNVYGIEGYYILWIKPADGPPSPMTVYCLELPPGFPDCKEGRVELDEQVEFTGYFFKNAAHRSKRGTDQRPIVFAKSPIWFPKEERVVELPATTSIILGIAGIAVVAVMIAVVVYLLNRRSHAVITKYGATRLDEPGGLKALEKEPISADVGEMLRTLADAEKAD